MTQIILIRHGQTEWNRDERFRGRADIPLNAAGLSQAEAVGRRALAEWQPAAIFSSPLSRAVLTAEAVAKHFGLRVQAQPGLVDIDYGEWQGLTPDEVRQKWPDQLRAWYEQPHLAVIPGGESLDSLRTRLMLSVEKLASQNKGPILLAGHTVTNRVILLAALGLGNERFWRIRQEPCAVNILEYENGEYTLVTLNDTCHLKPWFKP